MATSRIKSITVEIDGDTTGLSKALSSVNKEMKSTQSQLKDVEKLLKHNKRIAELGFNEDMPRPVCMKDEKLKEIIAEVLQIEEFDTDIMTRQLSYILSQLLSFIIFFILQ